ncbi:MAG TPA: hypothetical protein VH143_12905 [Kofleriaceae bacterium]|nr:hypothetical protein [Kofleriaceae bacterium]
MIGRITAAVVVTLVAACAQATAPSNGSPTDAPANTKIDAPHEVPMDAPHEIDAPMMTQTCTTAATCATATALPGMGGDEDGGGSVSESGYQAAWYSVRLSETDSGLGADPMSIYTTLSSPAGASFDVFVYVDTGNDDLDCATPTGTVTTSGTTETSNMEWGETGTFANDSDDSRTVSIEIRPKSGDMCTSTATWSLSILTGFD